MSYLYDKLKEALGGEVVVSNKSAVIKNWSPNNIKALLISRNYIIVVKHLGASMGCAKQFDLDVDMVAQDLDALMRTNFGKPKLNTLLSKRSLSCLEEIYVDAMFQNYPQVLDIEGYIKELTNSRLRYYGYVEFPVGNFADYLNNAYRQARAQGNLGYSIATDPNRSGYLRVEYKSTNCEDWYTKYYLRPQFYQMDNEKGSLAVHFRKFEADYEKYKKKVVAEGVNKELGKLLNNSMSWDIRNEGYLRKIDTLLSYVTTCSDSNDSVCSVVLKAFKDTRAELKPIRGLTPKVIKELTGCGIDPYFYEAYTKKYNVLDKEGGELDTKAIACLGSGLIQIDDFLSELCLKVTSYLLKQKKKMVVGMALQANKDRIPKGEFRKEYLGGGEPSVGSTQGYLEFLGDIVGIDLD